MTEYTFRGFHADVPYETITLTIRGSVAVRGTALDLDLNVTITRPHVEKKAAPP